MPTTPEFSFWLPTRPYSLIAAINRAAAAVGSPRYAMAAENADYNGHCVALIEPNQFKRYWTAVYTWAGNHTIGRGTLERCLQSAKAEYDRGALGASVHVTVTTPEDAQTCLDAGFQPWSKEISDAWMASWYSPLHAEVQGAMLYERHGVVPGAVGMLANSKTIEEYKAKVDASIAAQRAARIAARR